MKVSLSWLSTHIDLSAYTTAQLTDLLTFAGIEVEGVEEKGVSSEDGKRQRRVLGDILKDLVAELWAAGDYQKLMVLEYLFVIGGRNKDAAKRFGIPDEKHVAGIKFRAIERLRGLARQRDPNHSLFLGLWQPGAR